MQQGIKFTFYHLNLMYKIHLFMFFEMRLMIFENKIDSFVDAKEA